MHTPHRINRILATILSAPALAIILLLLAAPSAPLDGADAADAPSPPPNIIFILADDMGYGDPACYNAHSKCHTPNIDHLAEQGMRFTDAHAAGPTCVPSRYGLLTGRYPLRAPHMIPAKGALIENG